ncbi:TonB-dependent receptor [Novosphingobium sp.]|uniref:TonB-dependent receptor n=1 Tax=Novosphingobium sp. TaxID=1874826 RepID=UPI0035B1C089
MKLFPIRAALLCAVAIAPLVPVAAHAQVTDPNALEPQYVEEEALPAEEEAAPPADDYAEPADNGTIIVTATKREQTLKDVPVAVSVASGAAIERTQVRDIKDLQLLVPSLRVSQQQSSTATNFIIRGFGNGANNPGIEPSVGVFVDGVYRSRAAAQISDLPDVSRVEVLRGPQSTLFGKNASAGVISIITREPQFKFHGALEASYGEFDQRVVKGYVTGPLGETVAASISAGFNQRDGYITNPGNSEKTNERNRWFVRGQLKYAPSDQLAVRLIADYDKIDEDCCAVVNLRRSAATSAIEYLGGHVNDPAMPFADVAWSNFGSSNNIENWGLSGQVDYSVGPLKVTSITAWRESKTRTNQDSDFTSADLIGANAADVGIDTFTQELRVSAGFMDIFNAMIGGYFFSENVSYQNALTYGSSMRGYADLLSGGGVTNLETGLFGSNTGRFFAPGQGIFDDWKMKNTAWSVFGNVDLKVKPGVTVTLGGNYTRDAKDVTSNTVSTDLFSSLNLATYGATALRPLQFFPPFLNYPNAVEDGRTRDGKFTWTARIAFDLGAHVKSYVSYATGFKASSSNLSRDSRPLGADYSALSAAGLLLPNLTTGSRYAGPESAKVWELGFKGDWGAVSANLTFFKQTIAGFQSNTFTGTGFALANAGQQSTFGIEFDGQVKPYADLTLSLSVVYLDPEYDSFPGSPLGDLSGTRPAGIPALSATWGAQWSHKFANGDRLTLRGDFHYESPVQVIEGLPGFIQRDASGTVISYAPAFAAAQPFRREVQDLTASLTYGLANGLELSVWGRNLTNNRYILTVFDSVAQPGSISGYTNQPRTWGGTVRFKW